MDNQTFKEHMYYAFRPAYSTICSRCGNGIYPGIVAFFRIEKLGETHYCRMCLEKEMNIFVDPLLGSPGELAEHDIVWLPVTVEERTLLTYMRKDQKDEIRSFLAEHPDLVNTPDINGSTPLHMAVSEADTLLIKYLIEKKADLGAQDSTGSTPLHQAIKSRRSACMECLLQNGANTNIKDRFGETPLFLPGTAEFAEYQVMASSYIELLVKYGAHVNLRNCQYETPLQKLLITGFVRCAATLIKSAYQKKREKNENLFIQSPVPCFLSFTHAQLLLEIDGNSILTEILGSRNRDVITSRLKRTHALVHENWYPWKVDFYTGSRTPLHWAADFGDSELVDLLLSHNADPDRQDSFGWTPLHLAALHGHADVVRVLIQHRAKVNKKTVRGETSLHFATLVEYIAPVEPIVPVLVNAGARLDIQDSEGKTPARWAIEFGHPKTAELFEKC